MTVQLVPSFIRDRQAHSSFPLFTKILCPSDTVMPAKIVHASYTWLFADDCIVYRTIQYQDDCTTLQHDLHALADLERKLDMEFHSQKCSVLTVTRYRSPISHPYQPKGQVLEVQDITKYLGVDLQSSVSFKNHIERICKKANSTLGFLRRTLNGRTEVTKARSYFYMVRSNLDYWYSIWSQNHKNQIRKVKIVQYRVTRFQKSVQKY